MATINGLTAERMIEIEDASIAGAEIVSGNLILTKHDGTTIDAGPVTGPEGPPGPPGPASVGAIPGEVKLWPTTVLPEEATYGKWVWADGAWYPIATHPLAAAHLGTRWDIFDGASDPGDLNFRVPDLRGLVAAGLDQMPGGTRANRMTRAAAITMAVKSGTEQHILTLPQMASHSHRGSGLAGAGGLTGKRTPLFTGNAVAGHTHGIDPAAVVPNTLGAQNTGEHYGTAGIQVWGNTHVGSGATAGGHTPGGTVQDHDHAINADGGGGAHENVQPTIFVPYIIYLDVV